MFRPPRAAMSLRGNVAQLEAALQEAAEAIQRHDKEMKEMIDRLQELESHQKGLEQTTKTTNDGHAEAASTNMFVYLDDEGWFDPYDLASTSALPSSPHRNKSKQEVQDPSARSLLRPVAAAPKNRAEILDERAPDRAEADATRGLKEQVRVLKQQLAACVAAAAAQDAEKTALLGQVLRLRQQVGAPADEGDNRALKEQVLALKQKALTSTVREAAGCSGESATREMAVTSNNTAAALAPVRGARDGEGAKADSSAQALLERAEDEILTFWLIRGGEGAGGDEALTEEFFERADEGLDAQQLGERMLGVLGVQLEPAVIEQLMNSIGCGTKYISPEALRSWVHTAYPLFELEQMLLAVHLPKIVARHLVRKNGQEAARTREEVHVCVLAAASDIVDSVYSGHISQKQL